MSLCREMIVGFVKSYVTVKSYPKKLKVDSAETSHSRVVFTALGGKVFGTAVRHEGIFRFEEYMIKEVFLHKIAIALLVTSVKSDILVKVYRNRF